MGGHSLWLPQQQQANMNPLMLIPLMAMSCAAAPGVVYHGAALPLAHAGVVATHSVTHNVPSAVEYKQVGDTVALGHPLVHAAVPGYTVGGEIRTVSETDALPLVAHAGVYAHHGLLHAPLAVAPAVVKAEDAEEADKTVAIHTIPTAYTAGHVLGAPVVPHLGLGYHGLGLGYAGLPVVAAEEAAEEPAAEE